MITFQARPFFRPDSEELRYLPEGPRQLQHRLSDHALLAWVDIQHGPADFRGSINVLDLETLRNTTHPLPGRPGFFAETDQPGVVVIGMERRLVLYNLLDRTLTETRFALPEDERVIINDARVIINDGLAIPGGLIFGTKHLQFSERIAAAYYLDLVKGTLSVLLPEEICSNGKYFSTEQGETLLVEIDSPNKTVDVHHLDLARSAATSSRVLSDFRSLRAVPDGMRPAPGGRSAVVAFFDPGPAESGTARQISLTTGVVEAEWHLPGSPRVTCPEFIWFDNAVHVMFTTAVEGMPEDLRRNASEAGSLFCARTEFTGLPTPPPLLEAAQFMPKPNR